LARRIGELRLQPLAAFAVRRPAPPRSRTPRHRARWRG
jgi:hypothetical protein